MSVLSLLGKRPRPAAATMTLREAVERGLVRFELRGLGEGVTSGVELRLTKLTSDSLTIVVPRGTEFRPVDRPRIA